MIAIRIQAYHVIVEAESTESYPDAMTDLTNRAVEAFASALATMKLTEIPIFDAEFDPEENEGL
jgi:hypothetical protein